MELNVQKNNQLEQIRIFQQKLRSFHERLVPYQNSHVLNQLDAESFNRFIEDLCSFAFSELSSPDEAFLEIRKTASNLKRGLRVPTWRDISNLEGAINICMYQLKSENSSSTRDKFFSENSIEQLLAKDRVLYHLLRKFHNTASQLKKRQQNRSPFEINDEYDVQDLLYSILKSIFDDVEKERPTESFGGSSSRLDIVINDISTVIEVKKTRKTLRLGELSGQISEDKDRYRNSTKYRNLVFFIYDPDHLIDNQPTLKQHAISDSKQNVRVIISPEQ